MKVTSIENLRVTKLVLTDKIDYFILPGYDGPSATDYFILRRGQAMQKSTIKVLSFGVEGKGYVEDDLLKVRYPGQSLKSYTPFEADKIGLELTDAIRKDFKALRHANFVLMLKVGSTDGSRL